MTTDCEDCGGLFCFDCGGHHNGDDSYACNESVCIGRARVLGKTTESETKMKKTIKAVQEMDEKIRQEIQNFQRNDLEALTQLGRNIDAYAMMQTHMQAVAQIVRDAWNETIGFAPPEQPLHQDQR